MKSQNQILHPGIIQSVYLNFLFFQRNDKELKSFLKISKTSATAIQVTSKRNLQTKELIKRFKQLKQMLEESENLVSCDYYYVHNLNKIQIHQHDLSIIHLNISLASHIHELKLFFSLLKVSFDIICISESRISKHNIPTININIPGYNIEQTPTESKAGGTLMYH